MTFSIRHIYKVVFFISVLFFLGCSTKKNTWINRTFHNTTSKFNGYFNANEIVKAGEKQIQDQYTEDFGSILPLFVYGTEEQARSLYPIMDEAIKKCSEVIDRHSMVFKNKEQVKWIDDNYFLIGKASFYKKDFKRAVELFNYVSKTYEDDPIHLEAKLWLARTFGEMGKYTKAKNNIKLVTNEKELDEKLLLEAKLIEADISLKQKDYSDAVVKLETAIPLVTKKKTKARITFILAQIHQERKHSEKAIRAYNQVLKLRPDYEMAFYAQINQALAFNNKLNSSAIKAQLNKLLKDDKYKEFFDQVYYALAEIELSERNREKGMELLQKSASVSVSNNKQKARSFLRLADIHFDDRSYELAQQYYDSTSSFIETNHEAYNMVITRKESLTQLVNNFKTIANQDSLQRIAKMDEDERNIFIDNLILEEIEAAEAKARAEEVALQNLNNSQPLTANLSGDWYFYNPNALNFGKTDFKKRWGNRKLEDDWRRSNKNQVSFGSGDNTNNNFPTLGDRDSYIANLPLTKAKVDSSNNLIDEALYKNGILYKERLNDIPNAIESFEELVSRFDDSPNLLPAYYQLYRLYVQKENSSGSNFFSFDSQSSSSFYKDKILLKYPDSEFAELIRDPNYKKDEDKLADIQRTDYEKTFELFEKRIYNEVLVRSNAAINNEPRNPYLPKYYLLKARVLSVIDDKEGYSEALRAIKENFPDTEEGKLADDILTRMANFKPNEGPRETKVVTELSVFNFEPESEHYFILIFPKDGKFAKSLKSSIINFNDRYFRALNLKIADSFIDNDNQLMILRKFENKEKALTYFKSFVTNTDILSSANKNENLKKFLISTKNFSELFKRKNIDEYTTFFDKNYLN